MYAAISVALRFARSSRSSRPAQLSTYLNSGGTGAGRVLRSMLPWGLPVGGDGIGEVVGASDALGAGVAGSLGVGDAGVAALSQPVATRKQTASATSERRVGQH